MKLHSNIALGGALSITALNFLILVFSGPPAPGRDSGAAVPLEELEIRLQAVEQAQRKVQHELRNAIDTQDNIIRRLNRYQATAADKRISARTAQDNRLPIPQDVQGDGPYDPATNGMQGMEYNDSSGLDERLDEPPGAPSAAITEQLESQLGYETVDPYWSEQVSNKISSIFQQSTMPGSALITTECRSTLCKLQVAHQNQDAAEYFAFAFHGKLRWEGNFSEKTTNENGELLTTMYLLRDPTNESYSQ